MMKTTRLRGQLNEEGQSIVLIALFFFLVFLVFAALSVDGTMIYLRRRQLQNMADAAALAAAEYLSQDKNETVAYQEAMGSIAANGGRVEWYSTDPASPDPPNTNVGAGLNLEMGIQISDACDVRVALRWSDMSTYFTQFLGRNTLEVGARAHAGCNRAGGLQPIAVKRFGDEFDTSSGSPPPDKGNPGTIYCDECDTKLPLGSQGNGTAFDFLRPDGSDVITSWPTGTLMYQGPTPHAGASGNPMGREYYILGQGVAPSVGTTSYGGWVNLDIRHISSSPRLYYNNVGEGTNSQTLKDLGEYYIRRGYCCDIPKPGDEVAMLSGVSADFAAKAFQETYNTGDVVAVIIYNGTVYHSPKQHTRPTTATLEALQSAAVTYTIRLEAMDGFESSSQGLTMNVEGLDGFADWTFSPTQSPVLPPYLGGPIVRNLTLHITPTATTTVTLVGTTTVTTTHVVTGTRMFYVSAFDNKFGGTQARRYWAGHLTVGDKDAGGLNRDRPAVTGMPTNTDQNYPLLLVEQGEQAKYSVDLDLWGGAPNQPVTVAYVGAKGVGGGALPAGFSWVSAPPWSANTNASKHPGGSFNMNIKISDAAAANQLQELTFLTSAGALTQTLRVYVLVVPPKTQDPENYVKILGYAALEVMAYPNVNSVRGRIVSDLWDHPSQLNFGLRARLIPWEQ
jgi:hypothetical protein